jgi:hypothetical protein
MIFKVFHDPSTPISFLWAFKTAVIFIQAMLTNNDEIDEWLNFGEIPLRKVCCVKFRNRIQH